MSFTYKCIQFNKTKEDHEKRKEYLPLILSVVYKTQTQIFNRKAIAENDDDEDGAEKNN